MYYSWARISVTVAASIKERRCWTGAHRKWVHTVGLNKTRRDYGSGESSIPCASAPPCDQHQHCALTEQPRTYSITSTHNTSYLPRRPHSWLNSCQSWGRSPLVSASLPLQMKLPVTAASLSATVLLAQRPSSSSTAWSAQQTGKEGLADPRGPAHRSTGLSAGAEVLLWTAHSRWSEPRRCTVPGTRVSASRIGPPEETVWREINVRQCCCRLIVRRVNIPTQCCHLVSG